MRILLTFVICWHAFADEGFQPDVNPDQKKAHGGVRAEAPDDSKNANGIDVPNPQTQLKQICHDTEKQMVEVIQQFKSGKPEDAKAAMLKVQSISERVRLFSVFDDFNKKGGEAMAAILKSPMETGALSRLTNVLAYLRGRTKDQLSLVSVKLASTKPEDIDISADLLILQPFLEKQIKLLDALTKKLQTAQEGKALAPELRNELQGVKDQMDTNGKAFATAPLSAPESWKLLVARDLENWKTCKLYQAARTVMYEADGDARKSFPEEVAAHKTIPDLSPDEKALGMPDAEKELKNLCAKLTPMMKAVTNLYLVSAEPYAEEVKAGRLASDVAVEAREGLKKASGLSQILGKRMKNFEVFDDFYSEGSTEIQKLLDSPSKSSTRKFLTFIKDLLDRSETQLEEMDPDEEIYSQVEAHIGFLEGLVGKTELSVRKGGPTEDLKNALKLAKSKGEQHLKALNKACAEYRSARNDLFRAVATAKKAAGVEKK